MNRFLFFSILLTACSALIAQNSSHAKTFLMQRPLEQHRGLMAMGIIDAMNYSNCEPLYFNLALSIAGGQSFGHNLDSYFTNANGTITVGPNVQSPAVSPFDIRNSDLGLAQDFVGSMRVLPFSKNMLITLDMYAAWNELLSGLYTRVRLPFLWNERGQYRPSTVTVKGSASYPAGFNDFFANGEEPVAYTSVPQALCGASEFGLAPMLTNALICCKQKAYGFTYIHLDLGYNIVLTPEYRLGISLHGVTPASPFTAPQNFTTVYAPSVGQTHKGQLGVVLEGNMQLLQDEASELRVYVESMICGVLPYTDTRSLGLNLRNSVGYNHYLLLKQYTRPPFAFTGLQRAANLLYQNISIGAGLNTDSMIMLQFSNCRWQFDIGVDLWTYSQEKSTSCFKIFSDQLSQDNIFVPKGTAFVETAPDVDGGFYSALDTSVTTTGTFIPVVTDENLAANSLKDYMVTAVPALMPSLYAASIFCGITYGWNNHRHCPILSIGGMIEWGKNGVVINQWLLQAKVGFSF